MNCGVCGSVLAHDQRYCLECGSRRGPLPPVAAGVIASLKGETVAPAMVAPARQGWLSGLAMPTPRAAAVAVMALLAFGVVLGTTVSPAAENAAAPVILAEEALPPAPVVTPTPAPAPAGTSAPAPADTPAPAPAPAPAAPAQQQEQPSSDNTAPPPTGPTLPPIKHVFLIVLNDQGYDQTFGDESQAPYLAKTLRPEGELLTNYYGVTSGSLANQVALISGQGPNPQTAANCPQFTDVTPGTVDKDGQVTGAGCIYPAQAQTIADQLNGSAKTWKAYVEDQGNGQPPEPKTCRHPAVGAADALQVPRPGDAYVTWRNPFVYFHSLIDGTACTQSDVGLDQLATDLKDAKTAPAFAYIVPNRCHDGSDAPCTEAAPGAPPTPSGLPAADEWLKTIVPEIEQSAAYKDDGAIFITFDEAPQTGPNADHSACCDTPEQYPNLPAAPTGTTGPTGTTAPTGTTGPTGTTSPDLTGGSVTPTGGGGHVGLLLISSYVTPNSENTISYYNHFSLLHSIEDLFSLEHLGYATDPALPVFDNTVWNNFPKKPEKKK